MLIGQWRFYPNMAKAKSEWVTIGQFKVPREINEELGIYIAQERLKNRKEGMLELMKSWYKQRLDKR